jgi:hypothetical protein
MNLDCIKNQFSYVFLDKGEACNFFDQVSLIINAKSGNSFFTGLQPPGMEDVNFIKKSYDDLIPFFVDVANGQRDIYCYDFQIKAYPTVVVFSGDGFVNKWNSVSHFLSWLDAMGGKK